MRAFTLQITDGGPSGNPLRVCRTTRSPFGIQRVLRTIQNDFSGIRGITIRRRRSAVRTSTRSTSAPGGSFWGSWPETASVAPSGEKASFWTRPSRSW